MATSEVSICNLALQKVGAATIVALSQNTVEAREVNACYAQQRDKELRSYLWKFALTRVVLAPSSIAPAFTFAKAFPVPSDFLRLVKPARLGLDWHLEQHQGSLAILTNDGITLQVRYVKRVTDPTLFDPLFVEMLACKIGWHVCEKLTQSNTKKDSLMAEYKMWRAEARQTNAFEVAKTPEPVDEWLAARQVGQLVNTEWDEE